MKLVTKETQMSDEFRKGLAEGKKRIAGLTEGEQTDDELLGLIFVFETVLGNMKGKLGGQRRKRGYFRLERVK